MMQPLEQRRLLSVSFEDGILSIEGSKGPDIISVVIPDASPRLVHGPATFLLVRINGESQEVSINPGLRRIVVHGRGGDDSIQINQAILQLGVDPHGSHAADMLVGATIDAGPGDDTVIGSPGNDILRGGGGDDELTAGRGDDIIRGQFGDDKLDGASGNDGLYGGVGNDSLTGSVGDDLLSGGAGQDEASYLLRRDNLNISLDGKANDGGLTYAECPIDAACDQGLAPEHDNVLANIEKIVGGDGNDTMTGNGRPNILIGGAGDDVLLGRLGRDRLDGGPGSDTADGDERDTLIDIERSA